MDYLSTFKIAIPYRIKIEYFERTSQPNGAGEHFTFSTANADILKELADLLRKMPDKGDKFKKIGKRNQTKVTLYFNESSSGYFLFYDHFLQAPDTSFYPAANTDENKLFQFLLSLKPVASDLHCQTKREKYPWVFCRDRSSAYASGTTLYPNECRQSKV